MTFSSGKREFEDMKKFLETGEVEAEDGGDDYDDEDYDEEDAHDRDEL